MKKLLALVLLLGLVAGVQAGVVNGINYGSGLTLQTGSVFFNTVDPAGDTPTPGQTVSQGVGQISAIYQDGGLVWQTGQGGREYNFTFDNIILAAVDGPDIFGSISYGDILGQVAFYSNPVGSFAPTGNYAADSSAIAGAGPLNLYAEGHPVNGFTVIGQADADSNGGQGQLGVLSGDAFDIIVQDTLERLDGTFADMTFNFSADILQTAGYDWSGSADFAVVSVPVAPGLALLGLGLGMLGFTRRA